MTWRLTLLALLAGVLVAVPGPHDHARAASGGTNGRIAFVRYTGGAPSRRSTWSARPPA